MRLTSNVTSDYIYLGATAHDHAQTRLVRRLSPPRTADAVSDRALPLARGHAALRYRRCAHGGSLHRAQLAAALLPGLFRRSAGAALAEWLDAVAVAQPP